MTHNNGLILRGKVWHIRFQLKGHLVAESTGTKDRRLAEYILAKRKTELFEEIIIKKNMPISLHEAIKEFQDSRKTKSSYSNLVNHTKVFLAIPDCPLKDVTDTQLNAVIDARKQAGIAASTNAVTVDYFNAMIKFCQEAKYTTRGKLQKPERPAGRIRWLMYSEEVRFFDAIYPRHSNPSNWNLYYQRVDNYELSIMLSHTGARYSEIADMRWDQVDFENSTVTILRKKGGESVTMHMTSLMNCMLHDRAEHPDRDKESPYIFPKKQGRHNETHWVQAAAEKAGLGDGFSLHTFRHTRAVRWLQAGMNLVEIQHLLGHRNITTTMRYLHLVPSDVAMKARAAIENGSARLEQGYKERASTLADHNGDLYDIGTYPFDFYPG